MKNNNYINAYKSSEQSANLVKSPHDIVRALMFQLVNCMEKIVIDINNVKSNNDQLKKEKVLNEKINNKKSKNLSNALSIIYGLQTSLDFDKAPEIAGNLFQLYEFSRQQIISGFSQSLTDGIIKAINVIKELLDGWQSIPSSERKI